MKRPIAYFFGFLFWLLIIVSTAVFAYMVIKTVINIFNPSMSVMWLVFIAVILIMQITTFYLLPFWKIAGVLIHSIVVPVYYISLYYLSLGALGADLINPYTISTLVSMVIFFILSYFFLYKTRDYFKAETASKNKAVSWVIWCVSVLFYAIISSIIAFWFWFDPSSPIVEILYLHFPVEILLNFCFLFPLALIFQLFILRYRRLLTMLTVIILYIIFIGIFILLYVISYNKGEAPTDGGILALMYISIAIGMAATPAIILSTIYSHFVYRKL